LASALHQLAVFYDEMAYSEMDKVTRQKQKVVSGQ
jgi:hypothetical protein